jgi:hypothetical protein
MAVTTTQTNKPINPRGNDQSPKGYNRAALYSGKALDFDGVNDSVTTPNLPMQSSNTWTIVMNINITKNASTKYIFDGREAGADGFGLYILDNTTRLNYYSNGTDNLTTYNFPASEWFNLAIVRDGADVHFYNNGIFVETITHSTTYDVTGDFYIGQRFSGIQFFDGQISGFKSFSESLTAAQVADLYNNPEKVVPTGVDNTALKLWLPMMEGAGTTAYDGSGNGNHGTISGATWTHGIGAPVSQTAVIDWNKSSNLVAYSEEFDQWTANTSSVTANDTTAPDGQTTADKWIPNSGTTSANLRFNSADIATGTDYVFFAFAKAAGFDVIELDFQDARFSNVNASFNLTSGTITATGGDNVTEGIIDKGNGWYLCYIVGNSIASGSNSCIFRQNNSTGDGSKGYYLWGAGFAQASDIVPYVKTSNVIQGSDVLLPQGLTSGRDITGVNLFENVRKQGALNLDGNSWAEVHDNASLDITDAITLEAWVKWDSSDSDTGILGRYETTGDKRSIMLVHHSTGVLRLYTSPNGSTTYNVTNTQTLTDGEWYHIVGTSDGSTLKIYVNAQTPDSSTGSAIYSNDIPLEIGRYNQDDSKSTSKPIAQPRIYNRALTAEEVERNYNAGKNIYK